MGLFAEEKSGREITGISHSFSFLPQKKNSTLYSSRFSTRSKRSTLFTGRPLNQISLAIV
jgi:hypothetical protein